MEAIFERHTSLRTYVDASLADSSVETVSFGYKLWLGFAKKWNYPRVMQASAMRSALIAAFGCEMASGELNGFAYSANSVKTYKYGVTTTMDFYSMEQVSRRAMRGILCTVGKWRRPRQIFEVRHLRQILYGVDKHSKRDVSCGLAVLMLALSFARKSTVTVRTQGAFDASAGCTASDVWKVPGYYGIALRVKSFKGDRQGEWRARGADVLYMAGCKGSILDIVEWHGLYMQMGAESFLEEEPFFREEDKEEGCFKHTALRYSTLLSWFKEMVSLTCPDLQWESIGLHILRSLAASWALLAQVAETDMQFEGRWKSDAFKLYFRMPLQYRFGVTEKMQHWAAEH